MEVHINQSHVEGTKGKPRLLPVNLAEAAPTASGASSIDVGAGAPEPVPFATGVHPNAVRRPIQGARKERTQREGAWPRPTATSMRKWLRREQLSHFASRVSASSRLHRPGYIPVVGAEAITAWLEEHASTATATARDGAAEAAAAGDVWLYPRHLWRSRHPSRSLALTSGSGTATHPAAGG